MANIAYITALLVGLVCLVLWDYRYKLVFWRNRALAGRALVLGGTFFLLWDITGVASGIFFPGDSAYDLGWLILPGVAVEELFFLTVLMYQALILWEAVKRWRQA